MPPNENPLKLNNLQLRTLALAQLLAQDPKIARPDSATGGVTLLEIPFAHGDHLHIGQFTVSTKEASGLKNRSVWTALMRKGLARIDGPVHIALTAEGMSYHTKFGDRFLASSDH
ncbi:MAG: hypothetical protein O3B21_14980 [Proteobacteria bacterium]|nr:hypothetical protein [Pseudomonadota bacterium]MDA1357529.1 hypothetical protein [Pseudomonadota bacterium]